MRFDVSVDLTHGAIPPGMPSDEAVAKAQAAVRAIPGAEFVSVEDCRGAPTTLRWVTTYKPGHSMQMEGGEWEDLRETVQAATIAVLLHSGVTNSP